MSSTYTKKEIVESLKLITEEIIKPEPQYNTFSKYLAHFSNSCLDEDEVILRLTNSHGLQLKSDVKYRKEKSEHNLSGDGTANVPVLDSLHLESFKNINDILEKLRKLPDEWTVLQITKNFSPVDVLKDLPDCGNFGLYITRFNCGKFSERIHPYYVSTKLKNEEENFMLLVDDLIRIRKDYFTSGGISRKMKEEYLKSDISLEKVVFEVEYNCLKEWRCMLGGRLEDRVLEEEIRVLVANALDSYQQRTKAKTRLNEKSFDMIFQVTLSAHLMKNNEIISVLNYALNENELKGHGDKNCLMEELKRINLQCSIQKAKKYPVILIVDSALELVPWEMLSVSSGQRICRISSLHLLYAVFNYHKPHIVKGFRLVKIDRGFCIINPSKDLLECEKEISGFLKDHMPWVETEIGIIPDPNVLVSRFQEFDIFCYCGHGSGMQYLNQSDFKKSYVKGLVLLFGCSSNLPKGMGGRTPYHNDTYTYIINGCPCLIGCMYDIASSDADIACKQMLSSFLLAVKNNGSVVQESDATDVLRGVLAGKRACKKFWSQCSFVARGIPCRTQEGSSNSV